MRRHQSGIYASEQKVSAATKGKATLRPNEKHDLSLHLQSGRIRVTGPTVSDPSVIAEVFNNFFSIVATNLDYNIPHSNISPLNFLGAPL